MTVYLAVEMDDRSSFGHKMDSVHFSEAGAVSYLSQDSTRARLRPSSGVSIRRVAGSPILAVETAEWTLGYVRPVVVAA
jgi:hypothetical protein